MASLSNRKIGVDLSATGVRVAEVVGVDSYGYAIVRRAAVVPYKEGAVIAGDIKQPVVVGQALATALKKAGVPRQGFVLGASSRFTSLGRVQSPDAVAPHERTSQIRLSRKEISPTVPLVDSAVSWNLMQTALAGPQQIVHTLNVALMLQREVDELQKVCKLAGAQPQAIDLTAAGLLRSMVRISPEDKAVATLVDVGASKTTIATRQGLHLRSLRTIPAGGASITRALMGAEGLEYEDAEERKRFLRLRSSRRSTQVQGSYATIDFDDSAQLTEGEAAVSSAVDSLVEEIAKSIASDAQAHNREMSQGVQLCGGAARMPGFTERLQVRLGIPVVAAKPWADVQFARSTAFLFRNGEPNMELLADLAPAIGLALWRPPS